MKKHLLSLLVCSMVSPFCVSGADYVRTAEGVKVTINSVEVDVQYYTPSSVRIVKLPSGVPVYVKAGSILPLGPDVQYAGEKPWDNLEVRVYPGADGSFTLYEDEGDNYNYEKGQYSEIDFKWNDKKRELTVGDRRGSFPGMIAGRTFSVKVAGSNKEAAVTYTGKTVTTKL